MSGVIGKWSREAAVDAGLGMGIGWDDEVERLRAFRWSETVRIGEGGRDDEEEEEEEEEEVDEEGDEEGRRGEDGEGGL